MPPPPSVRRTVTFSLDSLVDGGRSMSSTTGGSFSLPMLAKPVSDSPARLSLTKSGR